jgi:hypothetical protein
MPILRGGVLDAYVTARFEAVGYLSPLSPIAKPISEIDVP